MSRYRTAATGDATTKGFESSDFPSMSGDEKLISAWRRLLGFEGWLGGGYPGAIGTAVQSEEML
jgi:hypothetical protein